MLLLCRQVFWLDPLLILPIPRERDSGVFQQVNRSYSYGDSTGFAPVSLLTLTGPERCKCSCLEISKFKFQILVLGFGILILEFSYLDLEFLSVQEIPP